MEFNIIIKIFYTEEIKNKYMEVYWYFCAIVHILRYNESESYVA